jgi:hypothetical protein
VQSAAERPTHLRPLQGAILFVLGVTGLSYIELEFVERIHGSTGALYVALASDLQPVLREWTNVKPAKASDPPAVRALTPVGLSPAPAR